jgi:hypothetical protein
MPHDTLKITGKVDLVLRGPDGKIKKKMSLKNLVVTAGKVFIAASMAKTTVNTPAAMTHMAVGTNNTAPVVGDTTLNTELARVALASATPASATIVYVATFPAGTGTGALVEAGIFNATPAGTMLCRTIFSVINKAAGDSLTITWTITIS